MAFAAAHPGLQWGEVNAFSYHDGGWITNQGRLHWGDGAFYNPSSPVRDHLGQVVGYRYDYTYEGQHIVENRYANGTVEKVFTEPLAPIAAAVPVGVASSALVPVPAPVKRPERDPEYYNEASVVGYKVVSDTREHHLFNLALQNRLPLSHLSSGNSLALNVYDAVDVTNRPVGSGKRSFLDGSLFLCLRPIICVLICFGHYLWLALIHLCGVINTLRYQRLFQLVGTIGIRRRPVLV